MPQIVEHVRAQLRDGAGHQFDGCPLPDIALALKEQSPANLTATHNRNRTNPTAYTSWSSRVTPGNT